MRLAVLPPQQVRAVAGLAAEDVMVTTATDALLATYRQKHPAGDFAEGWAEAAVVVDGGPEQVRRR